jgi:hypothetical protein
MHIPLKWQEKKQWYHQKVLKSFPMNGHFSTVGTFWAISVSHPLPLVTEVTISP